MIMIIKFYLRKASNQRNKKHNCLHFGHNGGKHKRGQLPVILSSEYVRILTYNYCSIFMPLHA